MAIPTTPTKNQPITVKTSAELLDVLREALPDEFVGPLERLADRVTGWELYEALAAIWARVSQATVRLDQDYRVDTSPGGSYAFVDIEITRSNAPAQALEVGVGSVFRTERGIEFVVHTSGAQWTSGENSTKTVNAFAPAQSYQSNVRAGVITELYITLPSGQDLTGETLVVTNPAAAAGGAPDVLSQLGRNRGVYRQTGEDVEDYRERVRSLPDSITPAAMERALDRALKPYGYSRPADYRLIEGVDMGPATDDDLATDVSSAPIEAAVVSKTVRSFYCVVPNISEQLGLHSGGHSDDVMATDDTFVTDGSPYQAEAFLRALAADLNAKRLGGVARFLIME